MNLLKYLLFFPSLYFVQESSINLVGEWKIFSSSDCVFLSDTIILEPYVLSKDTIKYCEIGKDQKVSFCSKYFAISLGNDYLVSCSQTDSCDYFNEIIFTQNDSSAYFYFYNIPEVLTEVETNKMTKEEVLSHFNERIKKMSIRYSVKRIEGRKLLLKKASIGVDK